METFRFKEAEFMELFQVLYHLHFSILIFLGRKVAALISGADSAEWWSIHPRLGLTIRAGTELQTDQDEVVCLVSLPERTSETLKVSMN